MPPDGWFPIPYEDLRDWLEARLIPDNLIERGEPAVRIPDERGERVYLALEDSLCSSGSRWVKIGKAVKTSPRERLRNQQCCNPRTLSHIRVWRVGPVPRAAETAFKGLLRALCSNSRSEWYMVDIKRALPEIDRFAAIQGYEPEVMWAGEV